MRWLVCLTFLILPLSAIAQQYTGMSGLIHVPSADMNQSGDARIGIHFLNKEFTPEEAFYCRGKYHTTDHYLNITPFPWIELGYTCTIMKGSKGAGSDPDDIGYYHKDRYFSIKIRPVKEQKWWPSVAVGSNDPLTMHGNGNVEEKSKNQIFGNFYIAATKHVNLQGNSLGIHIAYRRWKRKYNAKWNGIVGGVTFQPSFGKNLRLIAEYTGDDINVGADCLLWKHLLLQASLQNGKYFTGGVCFQLNLF